MAIDEKIVSDKLTLLKVIQVFSLLPMSIYMLIAVIYYINFDPIITDDSVLTIITAILVIVAAIGIALAYFLPCWMINRYKLTSELSKYLVIAYILRCILFIFSAICGLVIAILSNGLEITIPLFVIIVVVIILTFPTEQRLRKALI